MKLVIQRVQSASVRVDHQEVGAIQQGYLVLLGIHHSDSVLDRDYCIQKLLNLRLFDRDDTRLSDSIQDIQGGLLVVSQFTLYGNCRKGRRPSFDAAAPPTQAREIYDDFIQQLRHQYPHVETGQFGAMMAVESINDGPFTILIDSLDKN